MLRPNCQIPTIAAKMLVEALAIAGASLLAFFLRFDGHPPAPYLAAWWAYLPELLLIRLLSAYAITGYRLHWRFTSLTEFWHIARAVALGSLGFALLLVVNRSSMWPRGVLLLEAFLTLNTLMTIRVMVRLAHNRRTARQRKPQRERLVLVVGAGDTGERIVRQMREDTAANLTPVGFVDDDPAKYGRLIHDVPVLGGLQDVGAIADSHSVDQVLIAIPSVSGAAISDIVRHCASARADITILPTLPQMLNSGFSPRSIRRVSVEDLLERSPIRVEMESIAAYTAGQRILVTGAGGSIGSELCRQIVGLNPESLVLLGHDEAALYWIEQELRAEMGFRASVAVASIQDRARLSEVLREHRPTVVFHAAAHKHVPMMEANPGEAIKNNVFGTRNLAELAIEHGVRRFVMISTDKAVNPTSVMGASKRAAEMVVQSFAQRIEAARGGAATARWGFSHVEPNHAVTLFTSVRFGNVLGSSGSVIPTMQRQIEKGGPVTVTHPEMVRYFMTIPEAVQLVIQAGGMGRGGEIFVLDMGKPVRILDLAWNLIRLSGLVPNVDIPIKITGIRPGEKLYEEMLTAEEGTCVTSHEKIHVARSTALDHEALRLGLMRLERAVQAGDDDAIRPLLAEIVPSCRFPAAATQPAAEPAAGGEKLAPHPAPAV